MTFPKIYIISILVFRKSCVYVLAIFILCIHGYLELYILNYILLDYLIDYAAASIENYIEMAKKRRAKKCTSGKVDDKHCQMIVLLSIVSSFSWTLGDYEVTEFREYF